MNRLAASALQSFLSGDIDFLADDIKVVAVGSSYVYSAAHDFLADVGGGTRIATSGNLTGKTATDGVADAANTALGSPTAGQTIVALWVFQDTGVEATSRLIAYYDTKADTTPIEVDTTGDPITIRWSDLAGGKMFRL